MAKTPAKKSNTAAKKPKAGPKPKAPKKAVADPPPIDPTPTNDEGCPCCDACASLQTGHWGLMWRNAAGEWSCLEGPSAPGSDKRLAADENGPYWAAP